MSERSVTFNIVANFAKARRESKKTEESFEELRDAVDDTNRSTARNETTQRKSEATMRRALGTIKRYAQETKQSAEHTKAAEQSEQALARAREKLEKVTLSQTAATLALEAAQKRAAATAKKYGQESEQYARAANSVARRQNEAESSSHRYRRALNDVEKATSAAAAAAAAGVSRIDRLSGSMGKLGNSATRVPGAMKGVIASMAGMLVKIPLILTGVGYLITAFSNLSAAALSLIGPLSSLVGVLATVPQGFTVAAGAVGTFIAAISGVGEALKQGIAVQKESGQAAKDLAKAERDGARAIKDAQRGVKDARIAAKDSALASARAIRDAIRSVQQAEDDLLDSEEALAEARQQAARDIRDQQSALRDLEFAQRGAAISAEEAKLRLQEVMADPGSTDLERRSAQLAYDEALARIDDVKKEQKRARKDAKDAQEKGVEGSDLVVSAIENQISAEEALRDAHEAEADARRAASRAAKDSARAIADAQRALRDAQRGANEAMAAGTAAATAYADAMANLSPAGQKFVKTLMGMRDEMKRLRFAAQEGLLPGLGKALTIMLKLVPLAEKGLFRFGRVMGDIAVKGAKMLTSKEFMPMWNRLLESNLKLLKMAGKGFLNLLATIVYLMDAARPLTEWLSKTVLGWTKLWREQAKAGNENGKLAKFFEKTRKVLEILGGTFKNLWRTFKNIGSAGSDLGMDLLKSFQKITKGWAKWTGGIEGQSQLKEWFDAARKPLHEFSVILGLITREIFDFGRENSDSFAKVLKKIQPLIPMLGDLMSNLQGDFGIAFVDALTKMVDIFVTLTEDGTGGLTAFMETVGKVLGVIQSLLEIEAVNSLLSTFLTFLGVFAALKFTGVLALGKFLWKVFSKVFGLFKAGEDGVSKFGKAFAKIKGILARVGGFIVKWMGKLRLLMLSNPWILLVVALLTAAYFIYKYWDEIKAFIVKWFGKIKKFIVDNWGIIKWFLGPMGLLIDQIVKHWDSIKSGFSSMFDKIKEGALKFGIAIASIWSKIIDAFSNPIEFLVNTVLNDWIIGSINKILNALGIPTIPLIPEVGGKAPDPSAVGAGGRTTDDFRFARGGTVPGLGNRDSVPAMLMPGEFVMRKDAVKQIGVSRLHAMNEGGSYRGNKRGGAMGSDGIPRFGLGGLVSGVIGKIAKKGREWGGAAVGKVFDGVRGMLSRIPGTGTARDMAVGGANKVMDSIQNFVGGTVKGQGTLVNPEAFEAFARGGSVRKRRKRHPMEGLAGDSSPVQYFHKGGPVLGMQKGAKGKWVKALEDFTGSKTDGTWDGLLNKRLRNTDFSAMPQRFNPPAKQDAALVRWIKAAEPEKVKKNKHYTTQKGDVVGRLLQDFYGRRKAHSMLDDFLRANHFYTTSTKHIPGTPGTPGSSGGGGNIAKAKQFAMNQVGKPYVWGGVGPSGYDCSGMQSAVTNVMKGNSPYRRLFATGSMASAIPNLGFVRGDGGASDFTVGWYTGDPGHTSGRIGSYGIESTGNAVRGGSAARNPNSFPNVWHLRGSGGGTRSAGTPGTPGRNVTTKKGKYSFTDHIKAGMKVVMPNVPTWQGSRKWGEALNKFGVGGNQMEQWFHDTLPTLRKDKVSPHNYSGIMNTYTKRQTFDKDVYSALNDKLGLPTKTGYSNQTRKALEHALAHTYKRKHDDFAFRPWQGWSPLEQEIVGQQELAEKTAKWQGALEQIAGWGYEDLLNYLLEKGMNDGFAVALEASQKKKYAERLNEQLKTAGSLDNEDFESMLKLTAYLGSTGLPPGLRDVARHLGVSDYTVVKLWESGNAAGKFSKVKASQRAKLDSDVASYRQGTYYFASGGQVPGEGSGDTVPAMLTPGEFVIKKAAAKALGLDNLMALNSVQKFASGGLVMAPNVASIPTRAVSSGVSGIRGNAAVPVVNNYNYSYDVDINNPLPEKSTYSMNKMLQRQSALKGS